LSLNILSRKPDTPLTKFYALGKYDKPTVSLDRISIAKPGAAASLIERNVRDHDDIAIKPHQTSFDKSFYKPGKYLNPRHEHNNTLDVISPATNMHVAKLMNMKKSAMDQQKNLHGTIIGNQPNSHHSRRFSHSIKTGPMAISDGFKLSVGVSRRR